MNKVWIVSAVAFLSACTTKPEAAPRRDFTAAQDRSLAGPITGWHLGPDVSASGLQAMRDRAYGFCAERKAGDPDCPADQDQSLWAYANGFGLVRSYRTSTGPGSAYEVSHRQDHRKFDNIRDYCREVYVDAGAGDARSLGPCMSVGLGADYFSVVPVT